MLSKAFVLKVRLFVSVILVSFPCVLSSQPPVRVFHRIGVDQGLAQSMVRAITQDRYSFMWFGTSDGLNRYDGVEMRTYRNDLADTLAPIDNYMTCPFLDRSGTFWIGTSNGLAQFDYDRDRIIHGRNGIPFLKYPDVVIVSRIVEDQNGIFWIATERRGVIRYNPRTNVAHEFLHISSQPTTLPSNNVRAMLQLDSTTLLIGTGGGLTAMDMRSGACRFPESVPLALRTTAINDLKNDDNGFIWIATATAGLYRYDVATRSYSQFQFSGSGTGEITALEIDRNGDVWAGTLSNGLYRIEPGSGRAEHLLHEPGNPTSLGSGPVLSLYVDHSENLWIGSGTSGVSKLDLKKPKFFVLKNDARKKPLFRDPAIWRVLEDRDGYLWVVADGLYRINRATGESVRFERSRVGVLVLDQRGKLWIHSLKGLEQIDRDGKTKRLYTDRDVKNGTRYSTLGYSVHIDSEGIFWIGSRNGHLTRFDPRSGALVSLSPDGQPADTTGHHIISNIVESKDGMLYIARPDGLFRYSKSDKSFLPFPDTIRVGALMSLCLSRSDVLWIGTTRGLVRFNKATGEWRRFTEEDGLLNDKIWAILEDHHGAIWFSTNKSITRLIELPDGSVQIRNYDNADIPTLVEFNQNAASRNPRTGELFFGSVDGVVLFHPDSIQDNPYTPCVVLTGIRKFDQEVDLTHSLLATDLLTLPASDNVFSLRFAALEFTNPGRNCYAYMMEGFETGWVYPRARQEVRYTSLPPGKYIFRVKASNNDGVWNEEGVALTIVILPPFWQTWWFRIAAGLLLLGTIGGTIRAIELRNIRRHIAQLEQERALERERARISKDMHDEVGSILTKISILSEVAQRSLRERRDVRTELHHISESARNVIDSMSEIIWATDPRHDALDDLVSYLRQYASEFFEGTSLRCRFDFPESITQRKLSPEIRRSIFLTVKEALNNIAKHSRATEVIFALHQDTSGFSLRVSDNGSGFDLSAPTFRGHGLKNMKDRIHEAGGEFEMESRRGEGTTIVMRFRI